MLRILACLPAPLRSASHASAQTVMKLASATINDVRMSGRRCSLRAREASDKVKTEIYPASQLGAIPAWSRACCSARSNPS
jgi:hypothetical protein